MQVQAHRLVNGISNDLSQSDPNKQFPLYYKYYKPKYIKVGQMKKFSFSVLA
jgi:hypothetical protein